MPEFIVTDPTGKEHVVTAPDGATQNQALEYAKSQFASTPGGAAVGNPNARVQEQLSVDTAGEAIAKIGGAGGIGGALGLMAPELLRGAGRVAGAFPATRALAPVIENAGLALRGKRLQSGITGAESGLAGETAGQAAEAAGAPWWVAEGARVAGGAATPELGYAALQGLKKYVITPSFTVLSKLKKLAIQKGINALEGSPDDLSAAEKEYLAGLVGELRGGAKSDAPMQAVYGGLQQDAINIRALASDEAERAIKSADIEASNAVSRAMTGDVERLRYGKERLAALGERALSSAQANRAHMGDERELSDIGGEIQTKINARMTADELKRASDRNALVKQRDAIVAQKESAGQSIDSMPEYAELVKSLKDELKPGKHSPEVADNFRHILTQITTKPKPAPEAPFGGAFSDPLAASAEGAKPPVSFQMIDDARRQLGEVFRGQPAEGYKAIDANTRRTYYGKLAELQKNFAGGKDGPQDIMQRNYADATKGLEMYGNRFGKKATAIDKYSEGLYGTNAQDLPRSFFKSPEGIKELRDLTGNPQDVTRLAHEYAVRELSGKTEAQVRSWMTANRELLNAEPTLGQSVLKYANTLRSGEYVAQKAERMGKMVASREAQKITEAEQFADKLRKAGRDQAAGLTGTADETARTLLGNEGAVKRVRTLIESGRVDQWEAAGPAITQSAPARQAVFDAVKQVLADKVTTPASAIRLEQLYKDSIQPFVEGSRLVTPAQSQDLLAKLSAVENMKLPQAQKIGHARRILLQSISGYASSLGARGLVEAIPQ